VEDLDEDGAGVLPIQDELEEIGAARRSEEAVAFRDEPAKTKPAADAAVAKTSQDNAFRPKRMAFVASLGAGSAAPIWSDEPAGRAFVPILSDVRFPVSNTRAKARRLLGVSLVVIHQLGKLFNLKAISSLKPNLWSV
jgi:hypothetical protein